MRKLNDPNAKIVVVAHSQGTEVFFRALDFLSAATKSLIEFYGNAGQRFVPNDIGLKSAINLFRSNDPIPYVGNYNVLRTGYANQHDYDVIDLGRGGNLRNIFLAGFSAHGWEANYQIFYATPGAGVTLPGTAKEIKYPIIRNLF